MSPDLQLPVGPDAHIRRLRLGDARSLFQTVDDNRDRLRVWLPWVDHVSTPTDVAKFIGESQRLTDEGPLAVEFGVAVDGRIVGAAGVNRIDWAARIGNLGYWIDGAYEGRGLVAAATTRLAEYGFEALGLARLEIRSAVDNHRSRRVAERAGFAYEGTLRSSLVIGGVRHDMAVYGRVNGDA